MTTPAPVPAFIIDSAMDTICVRPAPQVGAYAVPDQVRPAFSGANPRLSQS